MRQRLLSIKSKESLLVRARRIMLLKMVGLVSLCVLAGCTGYPEGISPVKHFDLERYLGTWYEIARLDHSFERGLERVTAEYSMRQDGGVRVVNSGYNVKKRVWQEAEGRAYFVGSDSEGYLKVSFFGPFYGSYVIFELDQDYQYAFVTSSNKSFLWLLARSPEVGQDLINHFRSATAELGFDSEKLLFISH